MNDNLSKEEAALIIEKGEIILQSYASTYILQRAIYGRNSIPNEINEIVDAIYEATKTEQGSILIFLYSLLVLPRELTGEDDKNNQKFQNNYEDEYKTLNPIIDALVGDEKNSTYSSDSKEINYIRHMRNAIAHGNVEFEEKKSIIFKDKNNNEECKFSISLGEDITFVIDKLIEIIAKFIHEEYNPAVKKLQKIEYDKLNKIIGKLKKEEDNSILKDGFDYIEHMTKAFIKENILSTSDEENKGNLIVFKAENPENKEEEISLSISLGYDLNFVITKLEKIHFGFKGEDFNSNVKALIQSLKRNNNLWFPIN